MSLSDQFSMLTLFCPRSLKTSKDETWKQIQQHEDIPFRTTNINIDNLFSTWSRIDPSPSSTHDLMHPDRLLKLRGFIRKRPLASWDEIIFRGAKFSQLDHLHRQYYEQSLSSKNKPGNKKKIKSLNDAKEEAGNQSAKSPEKMKEVKVALQAALKGLDELNKDDSSAGNLPLAFAQSEEHDSSLIWRNPLANARVGRSESSKMNYIINEVRDRSLSICSIVQITTMLLGSHSFKRGEDPDLLGFRAYLIPHQRSTGTHQGQVPPFLNPGSSRRTRTSCADIRDVGGV